MQIVEQQQLDKRFAIYERLHAAMEKSLPGGVELLIFEGEFYTRYAWDARGSGFADTVTPQGWKLFQERLVIARKALEKAYEMQPDNPLPATDMISICMGMGDEPAETQRWFDRALAADPDNEQAVVRMLMYLEPKWHGSPAAMAALVERLAATHNYRGKMPLAMVKFHRTIATYQPSHDAYLARPEVWPQMQSVFESYLVLFPFDRSERTAYAINCVQASKWDLANTQFQILGDQPWPGIFREGDYNYSRKMAREHLGQ